MLAVAIPTTGPAKTSTREKLVAGERLTGDLVALVVGTCSP